ncbi:hypothetical protein CAPTEDRAFT_210836 [Capitella teleta]|uniref:LRRNT domain-containing protein n=1 Tax=Capitella teleta TaxID=283909 RepID=R7U866_CAPTE|nr:hypothetical protein CAPTEDRAFT_210836 [Capitella teleta]|eukprot:ELT99851.1 hypothetical protein CAPTEDRAFT_210836 [Capitella teleta]
METRHLLWLFVCLVNFKARSCVQEVDRSNQGLTSVPGDIVQDVTQLWLRYNQITTIRQTDFNDKFSNLKAIYLNGNQISFIEIGCFKGTVLQHIDLPTNELTSIPDLHEETGWVNELDANTLYNCL